MTDFPAPEKVRVLLTEYSALRSEIVSRMNHGYQLLMVATAAMAFLIAIYKDSPWTLWLFIAVLFIVVYIFAGWFIMRDVYMLAVRLREIEIDVNDRCDEDLLLWENLFGGAKTGFLTGFRQLTRDKLEHAPNPIRTRRGKPLL